MKARLLKKLLNETGYSVAEYEEYIAVGSPLCHDLIKVDKKTLKVTYALDTWRKGRNALLEKSSTELLFIWDKLHELISSGQISDIIEGVDEIENPLPVYYTKGGKLIESYTDKYGWPNTTFDGKMMYDNTHFATKEPAIEHGISESEAGIECLKSSLQEARERVAYLCERMDQMQNNLTSYVALKSLNTPCPSPLGTKRNV